MENQIEKINKEYNALLFEMESKLDLIVKEQERNLQVKLKKLSPLVINN